ncbi:MAG: transcriptional regulator [Desulfobacteraceae bacterium]|nr:transcriptional regulator [Desulfobacteraceae bacterium]
MRQRLRAALEAETLSARELSQMVGIPEREVYGHLEHLRLSLRGSGRELAVVPARCRHCGFLFRKRDRLGKPGRCPQCRQTSIAEPLFRIA